MEEAKQFSATAEASTKNFVKKPATGGIPAIENNMKTKVRENITLFMLIETQLIKYFGYIEHDTDENIKTEKVKMVNKA